MKKKLILEFNMDVIEERQIYEKIVSGVQMYGSMKRYVIEAVKRKENTVNYSDKNLLELLSVLIEQKEQKVINPEVVSGSNMISEPEKEENYPEESNDAELLRLLEENNFLNL